MSPKPNTQHPFTAADLKYISERGRTPQDCIEQLALFSKEKRFLKLSAPCKIGTGITRLTPKRQDELKELFINTRNRERFWQFVPASGAASRMFKKWFQLRDQLSALPPNNIPPAQLLAACQKLVHDLPLFAFYPALEPQLQKNKLPLATIQTVGQYCKLLELILTSEGLALAELPKGLVPFHTYFAGIRTAFAEHLEESIVTTMNGEHQCAIHFTVPVKYQKTIESLLKTSTGKLSERGMAYTYSLSIQNPKTDTIAADENNAPFRDPHGKLVFRPGGHGALLSNLADIKSGVVFIKNIDNVSHDRHKKDTFHYRQILGGLLIYLRDQIHTLLHELDHLKAGKKKLSPDILGRFLNICRKDLGVEPPAAADISVLYNFLNRPIRVCAVVKNEGEPGGGPFWVLDSEGHASIQIVESAEVDTRSDEQKHIWASATHFNPVDLVCCLQDHHGKPFDLSKYINPDAYFISEKSQDGKTLKALELPGLWNGAMAGWLTQLVEVPVTTFAPVKEITDLLKPAHQ